MTTKEDIRKRIPKNLYLIPIMQLSSGTVLYSAIKRTLLTINKKTLRKNKNAINTISPINSSIQNKDYENIFLQNHYKKFQNNSKNIATI